MIRLTNHRQTRSVLRQLRRRRGLTQQTLAGMLHVTRAAVTYRERGQRGLPIDAVIDTAHALGFTLVLLPDREPGRRDTGTGWPS